MEEIPKRIVEVAQRLKEGQNPKKYKVRAVLKWFGRERLRVSAISDIKTILVSLGLETQPSLSEVKLDDSIRFLLSSSSNNNIVILESSDETSIPDAISNSASETFQPSDDELEPEPEGDQPVTRPDDKPVMSDSSDWNIETLEAKWKRGLLNLQPKFQREYVWALKPELPSRLIESLLLGIPIPPIYFGKDTNERLEVIDGQQRLTSLMSFVSGKFALQKLNSMQSLNHKFFKDLTSPQQEKILGAKIRSIVIDTGDNTNLRYEVFERLNRGSMQLNEQELRNCVYRGPFNDLLTELERDKDWRKVKGGDTPESRFKEREMILRFFAFTYRLQNYTGNLKRFLNEYMGQYAPREPDQLKAHTAIFKQTMQNIYAVFGSQSARLYEINPRTNKGGWNEKFSIAALDIQASALANQPTAKVQKAAEQIRELFLYTMLTDSEMQQSISKTTGSRQQTTIRWTKFLKLVDPIINSTSVEPRFFDFEFRKKLYDKSPICKLCDGNQIHSLEDSTVDHIKPYSKGGKTIPENGQLAHRACNARKNAKMPD